MNDEQNPAQDRELGMDHPITRRDFLNGAAIGLGGLLGGSSLLGLETGVPGSEAEAQNKAGYYPPALTGMRGSHDGSFEVAHSLRDGSFWKTIGNPLDTRETYDLVIVGGGISGLAAAYFYRARTSKSARILILDNHDDFGGHAKRNEFRPEGQLLLANGGTFAIESPTPYSEEAQRLLSDLDIAPAALETQCAVPDVYKGLHPAVFFNKETFGVDRLVTGMPGREPGEASDAGSNAALKSWVEFLKKTPLSDEAQADIARLEEENVDYMAGLSQVEKKKRLSKMSYRDFLSDIAKVHPDVIPFYQTRTHDLYGVGIDAVPALDCWAYEYPGFGGMNLDRVPSPGLGYTATGEVTERPPYFFHFPDGNASIARALVRTLIPRSTSGHTAEDIVTAKVDYSCLDAKEWPVRIRLNSTVVRARHIGDPHSAKEVEVAYVQGNQAFKVRAKAAVMACWNMMVPYLCPELPDRQKQALQYGAKVPLVYTVVAVRNWRSFHKLGIQHVMSPGMYHTGVALDRAIDIGEYKSPRTPDEPILLRMLRTPCKPGLPERDQHRIGRIDLLTATFSTFERNIRDQLARILAAGGFDPARDINAITVNRWPHGYAYEYNSLWDPDWPEGQRPCEIARKRFGRITIANSDAAAAAYTEQAINQAYRAVQEVLAS
ncbi:MAG: NAD(P)-binding protein [Bryobacteraceae bacterium]